MAIINFYDKIEDEKIVIPIHYQKNWTYPDIQLRLLEELRMRKII